MPLAIAHCAVGHRIEWGEKPVGRFNCFGVKKSDRNEKCCTVTTREVVNGTSIVENLQFADYASLADSCRDYVWLITCGAPYHAAWQQYLNNRDLHTLIAAVARVYATDPGYEQLVATIAGQENVSQAIAEARREVSA